MKKSFARLLMLSCLTVVAVGVAPAGAADTKGSEEAQSAAMASMSAVGAANASAGYTGNTAAVSQPGQVMMPTGMQYGQPMYMVPGAPMPTTFPGQEKPEVPVTMRYNKKDVESGFYGAALPTRLFNNVPSDW